ncbi:MAG TPA: GWxTD domain-containing protein [Bacteroidetes bacterium]|nr:GWxTD domain-containing protein [Bacteroidota bacterium]
MKTMFKKIIGLILLLAAGWLPATASENLILRFDVGQYRFNQDTSLVEVYYGLLPNKSAANPAGPYVVELQIMQKGKPVFQNVWRLNNRSANFGASQNQGMWVDVLRYLLAPGVYQFKMFAKNLSHPGEIDSAKITNYSVRPFGPGETRLSSVELAQRISQSNPKVKSPFNKNGFKVVPNPPAVFNAENPDLYYYLEIYNVKKSFHGSFYRLKRTLLNGYGLPTAAVPVYTKKKPIRGNDDIEVGMIRTSDLPTGRYYLHFGLVDSNENEITSSNTTFYVYEPGVPAVSRSALPLEARMMSSDVALLSPKNTTIALGATRYFLSQAEQKVADHLTSEKSRKIFLYQFWKENDTNRTTPSLESFVDFMKRIQYANSKFRENNKAGWQTDRGRVFILYGKPSEIQYYPNVAGFREFQAWSYDTIEHGVVFIFGAVGRFGELQLIHSTKSGEIHNEGWLDLLKVAQGMTGMTDMSPGVDQRQAIREMFRRYNLEIPRFLLK